MCARLVQYEYLLKCILLYFIIFLSTMMEKFGHFSHLLHIMDAKSKYLVDYNYHFQFKRESRF